MSLIVRRSGKVALKALSFSFSPVLFILILPIAFVARFFSRSYDVGLGPEPLINNVHHSKALKAFGWKAETFVSHVYYITRNFDFDASRIPPGIRDYFLFFRTIFRYKIIYIYFNGGPLAWTPLARFEAFFYWLAKVKVVVMPYGGDIQDISLTKNLLFKHSIICDYPKFQKNSRKKIISNVDYWLRNADFVISGCDWVEYMWHWDLLLPAHFSLDTELFKPLNLDVQERNLFRVLHAPNHKNIKGTKHLLSAVADLKAEGFAIELVIPEKVNNDELRKLISEVDLVVDQLVIGWHGIFCLEAMSMEKPVICYIRKDFKDLYTATGAILGDDFPIINSDVTNIKDTLRHLIKNRNELSGIGKRSRQYVIKNHSLERIGKVFDEINRKILDIG